jgi:NADH-quinone oxidoreductase subunit L
VALFPFDLRPEAWAAVALPAIGFVLIFASYLARRDGPHKNWWTDGAAIAGIGTIAASAVLSFLIFLQVWVDLGPYTSEHPWVWMEVGGITLGTGLHIDGLSSLLMLIVSFLSTGIAIYSTAYMHEEKALHRYYFEIMLFITGMMGMVVVDNYLFAFMFWEIMGLCSYLLIGYWYDKPSAASAAKKAFLVTRIGDVFFLFAIVLLFNAFHTLSYHELFEHIIHDMEAGTLSAEHMAAVKWAGLFIFGAAVGKSAQFPLHVWLPDAMEGPTTVSALIHAATMVKAGVYITARTLPIIALFPDTLGLIALIGAFTAFLAATIAVVVFDIKRVLAYSTISQLAYMFVGLGTLGLGAAVFHLMNHAFFKALLFLGSGSVIHGTGTQDMRQMGGLRTKMRTTYLTFMAGSLSLAGVPLISGWWSKDEILTTAARYHPGGQWSGPFGFVHLPYDVVGSTVLILCLITAGLTGFYTFRMLFMTFWGKPRYDEHKVHVHESPGPMRFVLLVLSVFALGSGGFVIGASILEENTFEHHVVDHLLEDKITHIPAPSHPQEYLSNWVLWVSTGIALGGIALAWATYAKGKIDPDAVVGVPRPGMGAGRLALNRAARGMHAFFTAKWGMDWVFLKVAAAGDEGLAAFMDFLDRRVVDGSTYGMGRGAFAGSHMLQRAADGIVRNYATWVVGGLVMLLVVLKFVVAPVLGGG